MEDELAWQRQKLLTLPTIEQAKGLLMAVYGIGPDTAFAVLARWSQHSNTKLRDVAASLVAAAGTAPSPTPGHNPALLELIQHFICVVRPAGEAVDGAGSHPDGATDTTSPVTTTVRPTAAPPDH